MAHVESRREARKRRWRGAIVGTVVMQLSYIPLVLVWQAAVGGAQLDSTILGQALGFGVGVMPLVFVSVAMGSSHRRLVKATLQGMAVFILIGGPLFLLTPILGASAGYAAGGVLALRCDHPPYLLQPRLITAMALVLVVLFLTLLYPLAGAIVGGLGPFLLLAYSDHRVARRYGLDDDETILDDR